MKYLAWAWSILMIAAAVAVRQLPGDLLPVALPPQLSGALVAAAVPALPLMWGRDGWLSRFSIPVMVRVSVVLIALVAGGLAGTPFGVQAWYAGASAA